MHDVNFVFQNEKAPTGQALFVVMDVEFQTGNSANSTSQGAKATSQTTVAAKDLGMQVSTR